MKPVLKKITTFLMLIALFSSSQSFSSGNEVSVTKLDKSIEESREPFFNQLIEKFAPGLKYDNFCSTMKACDEEAKNPELSARKELQLSSFEEVSVRAVWTKNKNNPAAKTAEFTSDLLCQNLEGVSLRHLRLFVDPAFDDLEDDYKKLKNKNNAFALIKSSIRRSSEYHGRFDVSVCKKIMSR